MYGVVLSGAVWCGVRCGGACEKSPPPLPGSKTNGQLLCQGFALDAHAYTQTHTSGTYAHTCTHACTHTCTHACMHTHTHITYQANTHKHMCAKHTHTPPQTNGHEGQLDFHEPTAQHPHPSPTSEVLHEVPQHPSPTSEVLHEPSTPHPSPTSEVFPVPGGPWSSTTLRQRQGSGCITGSGCIGRAQGA